MKRKATAKKGQAIRKRRAERRAYNRWARKEGREPYSLANPPTGFTMSVDDLDEVTNSGRNQAYEAVRQGIYPSIRTEGGAYKVLVVPTLQILRGERPPGSTTEGDGPVPPPVKKSREHERRRDAERHTPA